MVAALELYSETLLAIMDEDAYTLMKLKDKSAISINPSKIRAYLLTFLFLCSLMMSHIITAVARTMAILITTILEVMNLLPDFHAIRSNIKVRNNDANRHTLCSRRFINSS